MLRFSFSCVLILAAALMVNTLTSVAHAKAPATQPATQPAKKIAKKRPAQKGSCCPQKGKTKDSPQCPRKK